MQQPSVVHATFVLERSYPQPVERVFAAFVDPAIKRRWFAEGKNHTLEEFALEPKVGGAERAQYWMHESTPFPGVMLVHEGITLDLVAERRLVTGSTMSLGGRRISASLVTIELLPSGTGTDLICTHQGAFFEGSDGPEMREDGWRKLFDALGRELAR